MDELPLFNSVFPFDCGYQSCDKVYHLEDFIHVALLWGFTLGYKTLWCVRGTLVASNVDLIIIPNKFIPY
jgi:hypothetical protein